MRFLKLNVMMILLILFGFNILSAMGNKPEDIPMKASKIKLEDGETIRMGTYVGGEKTEEWHMVARVDAKKNRIQIYWQVLNLSAKPPQVLPAHYTDYGTFRYTIDLESGSQLSSVYQNPLTNDKGNLRSSFVLDAEKNEIDSLADYWDGYELKRIHSRIPVRKGYPVFDPGLIFFIPRFLDITGPGIVYLCEPRALKQPIPISFRFLGRETVRTPAGEFKTLKISMVIADPFLSKLMQPMLRESYIWLEDSPRLLIVKVSGLGADHILEEVTGM